MTDAARRAVIISESLHFTCSDLYSQKISCPHIYFAIRRSTMYTFFFYIQNATNKVGLCSWQSFDLNILKARCIIEWAWAGVSPLDSMKQSTRPGIRGAMLDSYRLFLQLFGYTEGQIFSCRAGGSAKTTSVMSTTLVFHWELKVFLLRWRWDF